MKDAQLINKFCGVEEVLARLGYTIIVRDDNFCVIDEKTNKIMGVLSTVEALHGFMEGIRAK